MHARMLSLQCRARCARPWSAGSTARTTRCPRARNWTAAGGGGGLRQDLQAGRGALLPGRSRGGRAHPHAGGLHGSFQALWTLAQRRTLPSACISWTLGSDRWLKESKKGMLSGCKGVLICKLQIALPSRALCRGRARCPCKAHADPVPARFCYESNCTCDGDAVP